MARFFPSERRIEATHAAPSEAGGMLHSLRTYADFRLLGTPFEEGLAVWPARQTYADGQVKPWTGPPELPDSAEAPESGPTGPGPAAAVEISAPGSAAGGTTAADDDDGSGTAIWLGVIAIGISLLAAVAVGFLWSTRPARLPEDREGT